MPPSHARFAQVLPIDRLLIRTGFLFERQGRRLRFSHENPTNRAFLGQLLDRLELADAFDAANYWLDGSLIVDQADWLDAWKACQTQAEGGPSGLARMELGHMDPFMAGLARWLTAQGITTVLSCDGHGREMPYLTLETSRHGDRARSLIEAATRRDLTYAHGRILPLRWVSSVVLYRWLLDAGEFVHGELAGHLPAAA